MFRTDGLDTYIFFPDLLVKRIKGDTAEAVRARCFLNRAEQYYFITFILLPTLYTAYPPRIRSYYPRSFNEA